MSVQIVKNTEPEATEWWSGMFVGGWGSVYNSRVSTLYTGHCTLHTVHYTQYIENWTLSSRMPPRQSVNTSDGTQMLWMETFNTEVSTHPHFSPHNVNCLEFTAICLFPLPFKLSHPPTRFASTVERYYKCSLILVIDKFYPLIWFCVQTRQGSPVDDRTHNLISYDQSHFWSYKPHRKI